jgi:hypothetical protein
MSDSHQIFNKLSIQGDLIMLKIKPYKTGFISRGLLSRHKIVRQTAKVVDLNFAVLKYRTYFFHEKINICIDYLTKVSKSRLNPIFKSKIVCLIQKTIFEYILAIQKIKAVINAKLSKKTKLTLVTFMFGLTFAFFYFNGGLSLSKRFALGKIRHQHKKFIDYAFLDVSDPYTKKLLALNLGLYGYQLCCGLGFFSPSEGFKHKVNAATVSSTLALVSRVRVDEKITKSRFGPLVSTLTKPLINLPFSGVCGLAYYCFLKKNSNSTYPSVSTELILNELALWKEVRNAIPSIPKEVVEQLEIAVGNPILEHIEPKVVEVLKQQVPELFESSEFFPFFADKQKRIYYEATLKHCVEAANDLCLNLSKETMFFIEDLIKKGLVDGKKFKAYDPQNAYRHPYVTGISMAQLLTSSANVYDDNNSILDLAEIPDNLDLMDWLRYVRMVKFVMAATNNK